MKGKYNHHGPFVDDTGTAFRVWAPSASESNWCSSTQMVASSGQLPLSRDADGYFSEHVADVADGCALFLPDRR